MINKKKALANQRNIKPEQVLVIGFLIMILLGTCLLNLPVATIANKSIGLFNSFFTATSAVCVTGLVAVDTGTTFSLFGKLVLLVLIQSGGLGFMVFATAAMVLLGRKITLKDRILIRESLNVTTLSGLISLSLLYAGMAFGMEAFGALLLSIRFIPAYGFAKGCFYSIFHAVSAFCNAGFDLFGGYSSLTGFDRDPYVLLVIMLMILLGGTGFSVIRETFLCGGHWRKFSLHTKIVHVMNLALLLSGTLAFLIFEWNNPSTLGAGGTGYKAVNAMFQSVTMRTAGFNSVDLGAMTDASKLVSSVLMFIGASPASTGGGVKTTTMAVLLLCVWNVVRGNDDINLWGRRLPTALVRRAISILFIALSAMLLSVTILIALEHGSVSSMDILFEGASAVATVGVSAAGTPNLHLASRVLIIPMMFLGRLGPLTLAVALAGKSTKKNKGIRYPEESVTIG